MLGNSPLCRNYQDLICFYEFNRVTDKINAAAAVDAAPSAAAVAEAEEPTQVAATDAAIAGQQQAEVSEPVTMVRITPGCQANPILQILMC